VAASDDTAAAPLGCGGPAGVAFGAFAPPRPVELLRRLSVSFPSNGIGRTAEKLVRRFFAPRGTRPVDVVMPSGLRLRLHPGDNNCERKILFGAQLWNRAERAALARALEGASAPFVFVDLGANVGLYTLDVLANARRLGRSVMAVAVEPDPQNRARLLSNMAFNGLRPRVVAAAVSDVSGTVRLTKGCRGRGSVRLGGDGPAVPVLPLLDLLRREGLTRVDALKIDLEGHDRSVLCAFFRDAPGSLHPELIVCETGRHDPLGLVALLEGQGYALDVRTRSNAVMTRQHKSD